MAIVLVTVKISSSATFILFSSFEIKKIEDKQMKFRKFCTEVQGINYYTKGQNSLTK